MGRQAGKQGPTRQSKAPMAQAGSTKSSEPVLCCDFGVLLGSKGVFCGDLNTPPELLGRPAKAVTKSEEWREQKLDLPPWLSVDGLTLGTKSDARGSRSTACERKRRRHMPLWDSCARFVCLLCHLGGKGKWGAPAEQRYENPIHPRIDLWPMPPAPFWFLF